MRKILAVILCLGLSLPTIALAGSNDTKSSTKQGSGSTKSDEGCGCDKTTSSNGNSGEDQNGDYEDTDEYGD